MESFKKTVGCLYHLHRQGRWQSEKNKKKNKSDEE